MPTTILDNETYSEALQRRYAEETKAEKQSEIIRSPLEREQLVALAREAGFVSPSAAIHQLERFFNLAFKSGAAYEREACAKVCKDIANSQFESGETETAGVLDHCAAAIRSRSSKH